MNCPLDYSLCRQTVTIYRRKAGSVSRQVMENSFFAPQTTKKWCVEGAETGASFLLILPGETAELSPGDRVYQGIGPQVTEAQWRGFLPATVPGLFAVEYVKPCYFMGTQCHLEAGCRSS